MTATKPIFVLAVALIAAPAFGQQMFKCVKDGKMTFQQMPCAPANVGERMPLKSIAGSGEGLRESERGLIYGMEEEEARRKAQAEAASARAEERAASARAEERQPIRFSREDQAKIENLKSDLTRRDTTRSQRDAISRELDRMYSKNGVELPPTIVVKEKELERPRASTGMRTADLMGPLFAATR